MPPSSPDAYTVATLTGVPRPQTFDHLKSRKKPVTSKVTIALDSDLAEEFQSLQRAVDEAQNRQNLKPTADTAAALREAQEAFDAFQEQADDALATFVFRSIGRRSYEEMINAHPPTKAQRDEAKKQGEEDLQWNPDTFPPALIAACLLEPELTSEQVDEIWNSDDWNQAELVSLFMTAIEVNQNRRVVDLGKGSGRTRG